MSLDPPPLPVRNSRRSPSPNTSPDIEPPSRIGIVAKDDLEMCDTLGEGEFGFVYRGALRQSNGNSVITSFLFDQYFS